MNICFCKGYFFCLHNHLSFNTKPKDTTGLHWPLASFILIFLKTPLHCIHQCLWCSKSCCCHQSHQSVCLCKSPRSNNRGCVSNFVVCFANTSALLFRLKCSRRKQKHRKSAISSMWRDYASLEESWPDKIMVLTLRMFPERLTNEWLHG